MKTLKELRAEKIILTCDQQMIKMYNDIRDVRLMVLSEKIKPCKARKIYSNIMFRAKFYNRISFLLSEKYGLSRCHDISIFNDYVNFFEC